MTEETNYTPDNKVSLGGYVDSEQNFSHELSVSKTVASGNSILNVKNKPRVCSFIIRTSESIDILHVIV